MGKTAFLAEPIVRPGDSIGGPAAAGVGLQCISTYCHNIWLSHSPSQWQQLTASLAALVLKIIHSLIHSSMYRFKATAPESVFLAEPVATLDAFVGGPVAAGLCLHCINVHCDGT